MLSIDRVRVNAFSLFGLVLGADSEPEKSGERPMPRNDFEDMVPSSGLLAPRTPSFEAVETALRDAGYLDA